jgi:hypothetical protein
MTKILIDEAVVRQALEVVQCYTEHAQHTITALRQALANEALDKMADNARGLGLSYEQPAQQCEHRLMISDGDPANDMCEKCGEYVNRKPAQYEPRQSEIFYGVDHADGVLSVSVLRRRTDGVAELLHSEQIELPAPAQPLTDDQRREIINRAWNEYLRGEGDDSFSWYLSQAIEAAHGITKGNT